MGVPLIHEGVTHEVVVTDVQIMEVGGRGGVDAGVTARLWLTEAVTAVLLPSSGKVYNVQVNGVMRRMRLLGLRGGGWDMEGVSS